MRILPSNRFRPEIKIEERRASITNGKIKAVLEVQTWGNALQITFLNQKNEVLLREISDGGALCKRARHYKRCLGEGFS